MTRIHPFIASLFAALLAPACGDDSTATNGFTGATEAVTTTSGDPSTGTDTGTSTAPTTGDAPTGDASSTGPVAETVDVSTGDTSTGDPGTGATDTGDIGTTADAEATGNTGTTGDTGDTSTSESSTGDAGGDTLYAIQQGIIAEASPVIVEGVIVTAVAPDLSGLFAQEPDGGEYSGIWIAVGDGPDIAGLVIGDEIDVSGTTVELAGRTTIDAAAGSVTQTGVTGLVVIPEPLPTAVFDKPVLAEPWESVLIRITGAPLAVVGLLGGGEFKLVDQGVALAVDDLLFDVPADAVAFPGFASGATFTQIAGVVNDDVGFYKLAPRRFDDLAGYEQP